MPNPIVIAHHLMWTMYGWWLPNDPRGSTSTHTYTPQLARLAPHHYGRREMQPASRDIRTFYESAKPRLQHPLLECTELELPVIAQAFAETIDRHVYTCYGCAIMPDHAHVIVRKHKHTCEEMIENFQHESRLRLSSMGLRTPDHPTWTKGGYHVFLTHPTDVRRTIRYVESNPVKQRRPKQNWSFVKPYDDWPLHQGHSQNSPYVKALKAHYLYTATDASRSKLSR